MSIDVLQAIAQAQASWQPPQVPEDIPAPAKSPGMCGE